MDHFKAQINTIQQKLEQKNKTIKKQEKIIYKLQKRVKNEQQKKNYLASQIKQLCVKDNLKEE